MALTDNRKRAVRRLLVALTLSLGLLVACQPATAFGPAPTNTPPPATTHAKPSSAAAAAADAKWRATVEFAAAVERARLDAQWRATVEFAHAVEQARLAALAYPSGLCGGDLPPCWVMMRESRGDIRAENPISTASGKWQFLDSTWRRTNAGRASGVGHAAYASEKTQDAAARELWAGGRGCSHWSACR